MADEPKAAPMKLEDVIGADGIEKMRDLEAAAASLKPRAQYITHPNGQRVRVDTLEGLRRSTIKALKDYKRLYASVKKQEAFIVILREAAREHHGLDASALAKLVDGES